MPKGTRTLNHPLAIGALCPVELPTQIQNIRIVRRVKLQLTLYGGWWFDTMNVLAIGASVTLESKKLLLIAAFFMANDN